MEVDPVNQGQLPWVKALVEILMGSNQELGTALGKNMLNAVGVTLSIMMTITILDFRCSSRC